LEALAPFMQSMHSDPAGKNVLATALATYIHRIWQSKGYVLFHDSESDGDEARRFLNFIKTLPLPCCGAELISFDLSERSKNRSAWRAVLQISAGQKINKMSPPNSDSKATKSWLVIRPEFRFNSEILSQGPGQAGFRFALTMGFLRYGKI